MKQKKIIFAQSCDSRICRKKHKDQTSTICDAVTTVHEFNRTTNEVICTECGKITKIIKK